MNIYLLSTERLIIKPIIFADLEFVHALLCLAETNEFNTLGCPKNIEETEEILQLWIAQNKINRQFTFTINNKITGNAIGLISINLGKPKYKNAEIWFKFHKDFFNQGFATEAAQQIIDFGFNTLKLHRIEAGCAVGNKASIKVLEKIGMQKEAHTRQLLPLASSWSDNYGYAILESDVKKI
jgi:[ribosomal protein S5]-alanine N-acetyltransferase